MTFYDKLFTIAGLAVLVALIALRRGINLGSARHGSAGRGSPGPASQSGRWPILLLLTIVAVSLIVVGVVSNTLIRHVIQIAPLVSAILLAKRSDAGVVAAAPLFAFWLFVMASIWLFLLGIARIFTGRFTPIEIGLTIIIGAASAAGIAYTSRHGTRMPLVGRLSTLIVSAALQVAAMWLSTQPFAAAR